MVRRAGGVEVVQCSAPSCERGNWPTGRRRSAPTVTEYWERPNVRNMETIIGVLLFVWSGVVDELYCVVAPRRLALVDARRRALLLGAVCA